MTKKVAKPASRLGTRMRGAMSQAYDARGQTAADLHLHYSPKLQRDVVLVGQLSYFHFLLAERDPSIRTVDYAPHERLVKLAGSDFAGLVSSVVTTTDGVEVWRRLTRNEQDDAKFVEDLRLAIGHGPLSTVGRLEVLTFAQLVADQVWTRNTHRAIAWIAAARHWPLVRHKQQLLELVGKRRRTTFKDCLDQGEGPERALFGAAVLQLALNGNVASDLCREPLSSDTLFAAARPGA